MCDPYTVTSEDGKSCVAPKCGENEKITEDGSCERCGELTVVSSDRKTCIKPDCTDREFITKAGTC